MLLQVRVLELEMFNLVLLLRFPDVVYCLDEVKTLYVFSVVLSVLRMIPGGVPFEGEKQDFMNAISITIAIMPNKCKVITFS